MATNPYYQDELIYLRELGAEFARNNPRLTQFLGTNSQDPDIERLLEGFAFLTGRIRQKLDDYFPELAHGLLALIWPHYLRPIPPFSILQFRATPGDAPAQQAVPAGTFVESRPIEGTVCTFRTAYPVAYRPLILEPPRVDSTATGSSLRLTLSHAGGGALSGLAIDRLRLYLDGQVDPGAARLLRLFLLRRVAQIRLVSGPGGARRLGGQELLCSVGFGADEAVLPAPDNSFSGFRLIQEYFAYPEKFLFVDLLGLDRLTAADGATVQIEIQFDRPLPEGFRLPADGIRLNCTPIINLFSRSIDPVRVNQQQTEYRLRPGAKDPRHADIFALDDVIGWVQGTGERVVYEPFESFRHASSAAGATHAYYRLTLKPAVGRRGFDHFISFVDADALRAVPRTETIAVNATCTNGALAALVPAGGIDQATASSPPELDFANIQAVRPTVPPPQDERVFWRLIANLSRNAASLAQIEPLRDVLATYEFRASYDERAERRLALMLEGLRSIDTKPLTWFSRGLAYRGTALTLYVEDSKLGGPGETFLLGEVLDAFFAAYASINSVHRLSLEGLDSNLALDWPTRLGDQAAL